MAAALAEEKRIPILLVDSDGNIEELTGLMLKAGVTALYPFEVQAGNDMGRMLEVYPGHGGGREGDRQGDDPSKDVPEGERMPPRIDSSPGADP